MQSLPLEMKVRKTKIRIQEWYEAWEGQVYVSFSGGKDSTVLKHLVDSMYDDVPSVFVNTGLEYPEIQKFARSQKNVTVVTPEMNFREVLTEYGYPIISKEIAECVRGARKFMDDVKRESPRPRYSYNFRRLTGTGEYSTANKGRQTNGVADKGQSSGEREKAIPKSDRSAYNLERWRFLLDSDFKISEKCCDVMKKKPCKTYEKQTGRKPFIGTMASESRIRKQAWLRTGCNSFTNRQEKSTPMAFWTDQDVLQYILENNLEIASVYGSIERNDDGLLYTTGAARTGCIFCGFGCHLEKEPNRFQRLRETHPRQYEYCTGGGQYMDGVWQPSDEGLGLAHVLDYINVKYE